MELEKFGVTSDKKQIIGRAEKGKLAPYYKRGEMENTSLDAPVLLYVDDPVDVFILHIQGSGRVETPDGVVRIGYAANNGHAFVGIGGLMREEGVLEPGKTSMPHIREWLKKNPQKAQDIMRMNPRYIFFRILDGNLSGPLGAAGVPLTAERSLAVDTTYIPLNTPLFLNTTNANGKKINKLVVAQDIGSAIKGPIRGDYFWGYGEEAFQEAGRMKSTGSYILLWPRGAVPPVK